MPLEIESKTVSGSFTGTGSSAALTVPSARLVDISLFGGSGTIQIQRFIGGNWRVIEEIISSSFAHERMIQNALTRDIRITCTVYTSGTITYVVDLGTAGN